MRFDAQLYRFVSALCLHAMNIDILSPTAQHIDQWFKFDLARIVAEAGLTDRPGDADFLLFRNDILMPAQYICLFHLEITASANDTVRYHLQKMQEMQQRTEVID